MAYTSEEQENDWDINFERYIKTRLVTGVSPTSSFKDPLVKEVTEQQKVEEVI